MRYLLILTSVILLSGCIATPVKRTFPEAPKELLELCPNLKEVPAGTEKFSEVLKIVTENYSQYHECQFKNELWKEWYDTQKQNFDSVK
jgi:hypothetical protein